MVKKLNGKLVVELKQHEQKFIAARGGLGEMEEHCKPSFSFSMINDQVAKEIIIFFPI